MAAMTGDRDQDELRRAGGEPTYAEPDQQNTIDELSPRARKLRDEILDSSPSRVEIDSHDPTAPAGGVRIGRYQLLEMVGAGGMGMVWGAWDPELERRVAIKLVQPMVAAARERILAEGQALARLSHPNVVPIYDVGVMGEQIYLVMEWVRGITLRAYAGTAANHGDLMDAYRQAGQGLAAAHRAGIIHRDFKPDNVIRGDDERVRVLDFGLAQPEAPHQAREELGVGSQPRVVAGTPHYMAPELAQGGAASPASDQFAFCISLRESLAELAKRTNRPAPSWSQTFTSRGIAIDASRRFASMEDLLAALARDPTRVWRRRLIAIAIAAGAAAAFAVGSARAPAIEPCTGSDAEIASSWSPDMRTQMIAHLRSLGVLGGDQPAQIGRDLDAYRARWVASHRRACLAREGQELTAVLYERRLGCLARARASLATVVELLTIVPVDGLASALIARRALPETESCAAVDDSVVIPPSPAIAAQVAAVVPTIERARVLSVAARPEALDAARASVADARATGYEPLLARALLVQGRTEASLFQNVAATASLAESMTLALQGFDDVLALEAYARWLWVSDYRDPPESWMVMSQLAVRSGGHGRFGRALMFNNLGARHYRATHRDKARAMLQRALAETTLETAPDGEDIELVAILQNLSLVEPKVDLRLALVRRAAAAMESKLGRNHPWTVAARHQAAMLTRNSRQARIELEDACRGFQQWRLPERYAVCAYDAGWLADDLGDRAAALQWMAAAAATSPGDPRVRGQIASAYAANGSHSSVPGEVITKLERLAKKALTLEGWWNRVDAADATELAARIADQADLTAEADRLWRQALHAVDGIDEGVFERRVAHLRATVAKRKSTEPAEAARLADLALDWYRSAGDYQAEVASLRAIATLP
jgi:eukaryotic-like serine/threonine-protein kinase